MMTLMVLSPRVRVVLMAAWYCPLMSGTIIHLMAGMVGLSMPLMMSVVVSVMGLRFTMVLFIMILVNRYIGLRLAALGVIHMIVV